MNSHFYAMLFRMKYIDRWALMRNTRRETLAEHTLDTAFIAHALAVIQNKRFGGKLDPEKCAVAAMFHDAPEIITGDLPTPVKYYNSEIKTAYKEIEAAASDRILNLLPDDLIPSYEKLFSPEDEDIRLVVKAADKLSALIKCIEEKNMGNREFSSAEQSAREALASLNLPEANVFMEEFLPSFSMTLDEQRQIKKQ